jgi:hypothetical protein
MHPRVDPERDRDARERLAGDEGSRLPDEEEPGNTP